MPPEKRMFCPVCDSMAVVATDDLDHHDYSKAEGIDGEPEITKKSGHICEVCQEKWFNQDDDCDFWMTYENAILHKRHNLKEMFMTAAITGFSLRGSDPVGLARGARQAADACVNEFMKVR